MEVQRKAGLLIFVGGLVVIMAIMLAEFSYPGYSLTENYLSDLGVWDRPSASIFNPALVVYGIALLAASYLFWLLLQNRAYSALMGISGIGAIGVGVFVETAGSIHTLFSFLVFFFGGLVAVYSYRFTTPPMSYLSVILGVIGLSALVLFGMDIDLGLGKGGMERMIAYPLLLWSLGFGGHLMAHTSEVSNRPSS